MNRTTTLFGLILGFCCATLLFRSVESLRCYVCIDCEIYYNETQLIECESDDKCIKTIEAGTGLVSRDCGDKRICTTQLPPPVTNKRKSQRNVKLNNKNSNREKRSPPLLSPEGAKTTVGPPPPQISSLHCCEDEDGCNASGPPPSQQSKIIMLFLTIPLTIIILS